MNGLLDYQCVVYESGYEIVTIDEFMHEQFEVTSVVEYEAISYIRPIDPQSTRRVFNLADSLSTPTCCTRRSLIPNSRANGQIGYSQGRKKLADKPNRRHSVSRRNSIAALYGA